MLTLSDFSMDCVLVRFSRRCLGLFFLPLFLSLTAYSLTFAGVSSDIRGPKAPSVSAGSRSSGNAHAKPAKAEGKSGETGVVAKIGEKGVITELDLADFSAAESCYGSDAINSRKAGFMRMLEASVGEEILGRNAGAGITSADYEAEIARVDRETRAPEILDCIKKHFGFDKESGKFSVAEGRDRYKKVFLRKYLAQNRLFRFIHYDPKVQAEAYRIKGAVLEQTSGGTSFAALAGKYGLVYSTHQYTVEERKTDMVNDSSQSFAAAPEGGIPWSPFEKQFIEEHLAGLKPGGMQKAPIESDDDFQFVRLLSVTDGKYDFESLRIKKKDDYFQTSTKLRCAIYDAELNKWILGISGNPMLGILQFNNPGSPGP